jgi:hypothetical protein
MKKYNILMDRFVVLKNDAEIELGNLLLKNENCKKIIGTYIDDNTKIVNVVDGCLIYNICDTLEIDTLTISQILMLIKTIHE